MAPIRRWHGVEGVARGKASWGAGLARNWWKLLLMALVIAALALWWTAP